ncbi:hypothetical protein H8E77_00885 [bacterium]|nr:hypothetical protein [bacterium]
MLIRIRITFCVFIFLLLPTVVFAQQATKVDVQALELKMMTTITEMDKRLTNQIADLDKQLMGLQTTVTEMDKRLTAQIQAVQTTINVLFWAIGR